MASRICVVGHLYQWGKVWLMWQGLSELFPVKQEKAHSVGQTDRYV